jgi:hypothetical protein
LVLSALFAPCPVEAAAFLAWLSGAAAGATVVEEGSIAVEEGCGLRFHVAAFAVAPRR